MKTRFCAPLLFAIGLTFPQSARTPPLRTLSATQKAHILDGQFSIERNVGQLPEAVKAQFARYAREKEFKMANPGETYQATDVIMQPGLPWRRLLFAGVS